MQDPEIMNSESGTVDSNEASEMNPEMGSIEDINPIRKEEEPQTKPSTTTCASAPPRNQNLPCGDLLGKREQYNTICVPLYYASISGDWEAAQVIFDKHPDLDLVGSAITENYDTALHIATSAKRSKSLDKFVENLVNKMTEKQLELVNQNDNTALSLAAAGGNVKTVRTLLEKNEYLAEIPGSGGMMPLYMASLFGQSEMIKYLYDNSMQMHGGYWTNQNRSWVLQKCVEAECFDVALKMVSKWPQLAKSGVLLGILARKTDAFEGTKPHFIWKILCPILQVIRVKVETSEKPSDAMKLLRIIWAEIIKLNKDDISVITRGPPDQLNYEQRKRSSRVLFIAAEMGNTEFIVELIRQYPELMWKTNDNNQTIFHIAVRNRHAGIYNLLHEMGSMKDMITPMKDRDGNNMLHLVGKCVKYKHLQNDSGVGLQMQRELLWFKDVEALLPPTYRERKNKDGLTAHELFMREHKDLLFENEKWMKGTANQCLVVGALIASIAFAAAFGVPGGYNQINGVPMFVHNRSFIAFAIADAISLAFSCISILIFLSLFISRYAEVDFLNSLPQKLMAGLATLFFSIAAMLVGFSVSFFVIFQGKFIWVPIIIAFFISIPVGLYVKLQYNLFGDVYYSIYGFKHLFKPKHRRLVYKNPSF